MQDLRMLAQVKEACPVTLRSLAFTLMAIEVGWEEGGSLKSLVMWLNLHHLVILGTE